MDLSQLVGMSDDTRGQDQLVGKPDIGRLTDGWRGGRAGAQGLVVTT
jgi:hypothetical protein